MTHDKVYKPGARTTFGYRDVGEDERQTLVNQVFADVAESYDQMNDLMSAGIHRLWKDDLAHMLNPPRGDTPFAVLDVAGGTGDIAFRIARLGGKRCHVTVADISQEMIAAGRKRAARNGLARRCEFIPANAEDLPFGPKSFDAYTIAFGIRNVTHIEKALAEAYRVLRHGGRFLCLEFSHVDVPGLAGLYEAYSDAAIPALGHAVTGRGAAYRYLIESIRKFPDQQAFAKLIEKAGFVRVKYRNLSGGIVAIHSGWRI